MAYRYYSSMAIVAGGLLATMIFLNGILSSFTSPFVSSLIVHLVGLLSSFVLWISFNLSNRHKLISFTAPFWSYLGGFGGALVVVSANVVVNSPLGLAGSLSFFILGQTFSALIIDLFGLFGTTRRKITSRDGLSVVSILIGALFLIRAGGQA